jgi:hypothetical protein
MKVEKQTLNQEKLSEKHQNLHLVSQIEGKSLFGNAEINVLILKHRR